MSENENSRDFFPVTKAGKEVLEKELKHLLSVERPQIVAAIEEARSHGDLKENAEYHAAKEKQGFIESRIRYLESVTAGSPVIDPSALSYAHVAFGATVELLAVETDKMVSYQIVGVDEADIENGKISIDSPVARAIIGKHEGDEVMVNTPKGKVAYEINQIEYK